MFRGDQAAVLDRAAQALDRLLARHGIRQADVHRIGVLGVHLVGQRFLGFGEGHVDLPAACQKLIGQQCGAEHVLFPRRGGQQDSVVAVADRMYRRAVSHRMARKLQHAQRDGQIKLGARVFKPGIAERAGGRFNQQRQQGIGGPSIFRKARHHHIEGPVIAVERKFDQPVHMACHAGGRALCLQGLARQIVEAAVQQQVPVREQPACRQVLAHDLDMVMSGVAPDRRPELGNRHRRAFKGLEKAALLEQKHACHIKAAIAGAGLAGEQIDIAEARHGCRDAPIGQARDPFCSALRPPI